MKTAEARLAVTAMSHDHSPRARTLRLALALRGGISLAVWIGGAVAEIDLLRRREPAELHGPRAAEAAGHQVERAKIYGNLLRIAGYNGVEVDILAGASAGGLNAVLYGVAQSVGATMDQVRGTWSELAAIWKLLRPTLPVGRVPSLLLGDRYFYEEVYKALGQLVEGATPKPDLPPFITIDLSATLLTGGGLSELPLREGRAHFHFARRPAPIESGFTDLPGPSDVGGAPDRLPAGVEFRLRRLALAARATSSFPGAFEPASVHSVEDPPERYADGTDGVTVPHMTGVFSGICGADTALRDEQAKPFHVVDGGVFDNIPIDRALRAIAMRPADAPTERRLIYLDPDPAPSLLPPSPVTAPRDAMHWLGVVFRGRQLQQRRETALDELAMVRTHNERELAARGRHDALAAQLSQLGCGPIPIVPVERYAGFRATLDAPRIARLLTRPAESALGHPPLNKPRQALDERAAMHLKNALVTAYEQPDVPARLASDVQGALDTAVLLVNWIQALEQRRDRVVVRGPEPDLSSTKRTLYRIMRVAAHVRDLADAEFLCSDVAAPSPTTLPDLAGAVRRSLALQDGLPPLGTPLLAALSDGTEADFYRRLAERFPRDGAPQPRSGAAGSLLADLWNSLGAAREAVLTNGQQLVTARYRPEVSAWEKRQWDESLFAVLHQRRGRSMPVRSLHLLVAPAGGVPGTTSMIRYHEITGGQATPLEPLFVKLLEEERVARIEALLRNKPAGPGAPLLTAKSKLAGNTAGNFGGFLSRRWRDNDWLWGRLDAAAGLVDVLLERAHQARPEDFWKAWKEYVDKPVPNLDDRWASLLSPDTGALPPAAAGEQPTAEHVACLRHGAQAWLQHLLLEEEGACGHPTSAPEKFVAGGERVTDLRSGYRFALATRLTHLGYRAVWPARWSPRLALGRLFLIVFRPLLILLPLLVDPVRGALAAGAVLFSAELLSDPAGRGPVYLAGAALLTGGLFYAARLAIGWLKWRRVRCRVGGWTTEFGELVEKGWKSKRLGIWLGVPVGVLVAAAVVLLIGAPLLGLSFGQWLNTLLAPWQGERLERLTWPAAVAIALLAGAVAFSAPGRLYQLHGVRRGRGWLQLLLGVVVALVLFGSIVAHERWDSLATWVSSGLDKGWLPDGFVIGMVALTVALCWVLLGAWSSGHWALLATTAVAAANGMLASSVGEHHWCGLWLTILVWLACMTLITLVLPQRPTVQE